MSLENDNLITKEEYVGGLKSAATRTVKRAIFEVVAAVLLVALFFFENGELVVKEQSFIALLGNIAVMFVISVLFDESYRIKGKLTAFETKDYLFESERLAKNLSTLDDAAVKRIKAKLESFVAARYEAKLNRLLLPFGITACEYRAKYAFRGFGQLKRLSLSRPAFRAVLRARRLKAESLSLDMLLASSREEGTATLPKSERNLDLNHGAKTIFGYLLTAALFAYFGVALCQDFSLASLGWYLVKVCFLAFRGANSYFSAYLEITGQVTSRLRTQNFYLELFSKE